jgi:para-nitrobenzyl esterase
MESHVIAETESGKIRGINANGINVFKGIPYAAPPVGDLRFRAPAKVTPWTGVRDTFAFGHRAMQDDNAFALPPAIIGMFDIAEPAAMAEDCLVLNVWTPALRDGRRRPVMFWCHGGAFIAGSGSAPWYDGANLCRKGDVVVVTINHRLGAFGFLNLGDTAGDEFADAGCAGMLDIVAALEWVRNNIAEFGGDADNVTIFGESGGGAKVCVLMAMPSARGLFHKAIVQSGPAVRMASREDAGITLDKVLAQLDIPASRARDLRDIPAEAILKAQIEVLRSIPPASFSERRRIGFNPVIDGRNLPGGPFDPIAPAISSNIPLMIGTNKDEMTLFFGFAPWLDNLDESAMRDRMRILVGDRADAIADAYRRARPADSPRDIVLAAATDQSMRIPSLIIADRQCAQHAAPVFVYMFTYETPVLGGRLKSPHALEIPFVFDNVVGSKITGDSPARLPLADRMARTWISFARTGNPNNGVIPAWPAYSPATRPTMIFDLECRIENDPQAAERMAWSGQ